MPNIFHPYPYRLFSLAATAAAAAAAAAIVADVIAASAAAVAAAAGCCCCPHKISRSAELHSPHKIQGMCLHVLHTMFLK